jgi:hypothetical protein
MRPLLINGISALSKRSLLKPVTQSALIFSGISVLISVIAGKKATENATNNSEVHIG